MTDTDRTLLEKAARAADLDVDITEMGGIPVGIWRKGSTHPDAVRCFWGPLREDGDALRLAVRLARSGNYRRLSELRKALEEDFPDAIPGQVQEALKKLANYYMGSRQHDQ